MVDSRLRIPLPRLFECFVEVSAPNPEDGIGPLLKRFHPDNFEEKKELIAQIPTFCFPCRTDSPGVQYFTFVLTDIEGKFRFGFCRYPAHAPSCICIISYAPWFEMFYKVLNNISDAELRGESDFVIPLLDELRTCPIPDVGSSVSVTAKYLSTSKLFKYDVPDSTKLPTIPENRNLTEYFAAITPEIMVQLFISMLFERRILVTSKKLSLVTAIVHGSVSLLYPMQWQHIFVPVLPPKLLDYCCAPMPFLLGVHSSMMKTVRQMPLDDVVILDADKNEISSPFDDMMIFPQEVISKLLSKLKKTERALDDYVASQFIRALVKVIGGYHDSLKFKEIEDGEGGKIVFDEEAFLVSRTSSIRPFLEHILHLQSFMQFIAGRLDLLNAGIEVADIFEQEIIRVTGDNSKWRSQYQQWSGKMKKSGGVLKKTVGIQYAFLKGKANDMELKSKVKAIYKGAKSGVKTGYKGAKHQIKEIKHQIKVKDSHESRVPIPEVPVKRAGSFPSSHLMNVKETPFRHTMYSTLPSSRIHHGLKRIPKPGTPAKPPRTTNLEKYAITKSVSTDCIASVCGGNETDQLNQESSETLLQLADTHSEPSIANLIDLDSISLKETCEQATTESIDLFAKENPSFCDDQFFIVDDEDVNLGQKDANDHSRHSTGSWVTFDEDVTRQSSLKKESVPSPVVEIGYEDLFKADLDHDKFVVVSSDHAVTEARLDDLLKPRLAISTTSSIEDASSLLTDTLSSMSAETRSLFTKPNEDTDRPQMQAHPPSIEKRRRRPPPKPPLSRTGPPHGHPSPHIKNLPHRPPAHPTDQNEAKCLQATKVNNGNSLTPDPFADLLMETRNSLSINQTRK